MWVLLSTCGVFVLVLLGEGELNSMATPSGVRVLGRGDLEVTEFLCGFYLFNLASNQGVNVL